MTDLTPENLDQFTSLVDESLDLRAQATVMYQTALMLIDHVDDIVGSPLQIDTETVWIHTRQQVASWLEDFRDRAIVLMVAQQPKEG